MTDFRIMAQLLDFYFSPSVASAQHFQNTIIEREKSTVLVIASSRRKTEILRFRGKIFTEYVRNGSVPAEADAVLIGTGVYEEVTLTGEIF